MKVYVDSSADIQYASYYIYGLYHLYGKKNVRFTSKYFEHFKHDNHFFAFVLLDKNTVKRVVIDFTDSTVINDVALNWCDIYGKINLESTDNLSHKIVVIGPSFGIQLYGLFETFWFAFSNLLKAKKRIPNIRKFLSDYKAQYKRPQLVDYKNSKPKLDYVFFMASLWKQEPMTNEYRANFIKSCELNSSIHFEGGFAPRTKNDIEGFEALTTDARVEMTLYMQNIKRSALVFNTPAVKGCHGWKLAEYLCLGKAIISTPLSRVMPGEFRNATHFISTTGTVEDISEQINMLLLKPELRARLEAEALLYFNTYLAPEKVIKSLVGLC